LQQRSGACLPRLDRVASAGPVLAGRVYALPEEGPPQPLPAAVLVALVVVLARELVAPAAAVAAPVVVSVASPGEPAGCFICDLS